MGYDRLKADLDRGDVVLLDGATGTELQRRGAMMDPVAWCGAAGQNHAATLEVIHRDYLAAGARIVTANTFATARHVLAAAGFGEAYGEINGRTLAAARAAVSAYPEAVLAGSLSHMIPPGDPDPVEFADGLVEQAEMLAEGGCEVILLEMMFAPERIEPAFRAAAATGLPVWAGFSVRRGAGDEVLAFARQREIPFADVLAILEDYPVDAAGIMHSEPEVTGEAIAMLKARFAGPLSAYPDSGHMIDHDWQFQDIISPEALTDYAAQWIDQGVQVIGGCCGLGVDHIGALAPLTKERLNA